MLRPSFVQEARSLEPSNNQNLYEEDSDTQHASTGTKQISANSNIGTFAPQHIGNHTRIGHNCVIEAAAIGSSVVIGNNCVLCERVIIKDCVWIDDFTVVPSDMVIPPCKFSISTVTYLRMMLTLLSSAFPTIIIYNHSLTS